MSAWHTLLLSVRATARPKNWTGQQLPLHRVGAWYCRQTEIPDQHVHVARERRIPVDKPLIFCPGIGQKSIHQEAVVNRIYDPPKFLQPTHVCVSQVEALRKLPQHCFAGLGNCATGGKLELNLYFPNLCVNPVNVFVEFPDESSAMLRNTIMLQISIIGQNPTIGQYIPVLYNYSLTQTGHLCESNPLIRTLKCGVAVRPLGQDGGVAEEAKAVHISSVGF